MARACAKNSSVALRCASRLSGSRPSTTASLASSSRTLATTSSGFRPARSQGHVTLLRLSCPSITGLRLGKPAA